MQVTIISNYTTLKSWIQLTINYKYFCKIHKAACVAQVSAQFTISSNEAMIKHIIIIIISIYVYQFLITYIWHKI